MDELKLTPETFLRESSKGLVVDVRSPSEFVAGHIPGAVNLPLFSDDERSMVGTAYAKSGKDCAVELGLSLVGSKMVDMVREAKNLSGGKPLYIHCWRGGMRSGSVAWLLSTAGMTTYVLEGGYKAYRQDFVRLLEDTPWKFIVLGGPTGCGKTYVLRALAERGEQVLPLEGLAHHKGSAFGALGEERQPTTEQFGNNLHAVLRGFDPSRPVWCEGESETIGRVSIPKELFLCMRLALLINFELPFELRVRHIVRDYGNFPAEMLIESFRKIERRLGAEATGKAIASIQTGDLETAVTLALYYYDKAYAHSYASLWKVTHTYKAVSDDPQTSSSGLLELLRKELLY